MMNINEQYKRCLVNIMLFLYITTCRLFYWQKFAEPAINVGMDKHLYPHQITQLSIHM